jgi:HEAT repeat protein
MSQSPSAKSQQQFIEDLSHSDGVVRGRAIDLLAQNPRPGLVDRLRPMLEDPDWVVCFKAACALAWVGDDEAVSLLVEALSQRELCYSALQALTELGSPKALPGLQTFFKRRFLHPLERLQAAGARYRSGDELAAEFIIERRKQGQPEERGFALELTGRLRLPGAFECLAQVLGDREHALRLDAVRGLVDLGDARATKLLERVSAETGDPELAEEALAGLELLRTEEP